jgi:ribosomal protein S18 acetylase RimI-like enzyme
VDFTLRKLRPGDFEVLWAIDQKCFPPGISYSRQELSTYIRRWSAFTVVAEQESPKESAIHDSSPHNRSPHNRSLDKEMSNKNAVSQNALQQNNIVGFIVAEISRRNEGHIITIDVLPEVRQQGIGSKLLATAEERLREAKCATVVLEAAVDNKAALAFYDRHKYFAFKTLAHYYPNGVNAFVLRKDLLSEARAS